MPAAIVITRTFDASPERVYAAWTTPELFSVWFGTEYVDVPLETLSLDVRVGGAWAATMILPDETTIDWVGEYTEVEAPYRLAFTMTDDPSNPAREPVTVTITDGVDGGTEMTMTQSGEHLSEEQIEMATAGYGGFFDAMETLLAPPAG
jgi:uncharacterized protein YndB with AHSA1/START domain